MAWGDGQDDDLDKLRDSPWLRGDESDDLDRFLDQLWNSIDRMIMGSGGGSRFPIVPAPVAPVALVRDEQWLNQLGITMKPAEEVSE